MRHRHIDHADRRESNRFVSPIKQPNNSLVPILRSRGETASGNGKTARPCSIEINRRDNPASDCQEWASRVSCRAVTYYTREEEREIICLRSDLSKSSDHFGQSVQIIKSETSTRVRACMCVCARAYTSTCVRRRRYTLFRARNIVEF